MKKKAHRIKFKWPSEKDVRNEFLTELTRRVNRRLEAEMKAEDSLFDRSDYILNNKVKIEAQEKLKLMDEWKNRGRKIDPFIDYQSDIMRSIYGRLIH